MNSPSNQQLEQYRQVKVETSTTIDLVRMAYDGIIDNLEQAIEALEGEALEGDHKSYDVFNEKLSTAQQVVSALDDGLDEEQGELAEVLANFYSFVRRKLIDSNMSKSVPEVKEALDIVRQVREYWYSSEVEPEDSTNEPDSEEKKGQIDFAR